MWQNRIIGSGSQPASAFKTNQRNWRIHSLEQQIAQGQALDSLGWIQEVIVNETTGNLIDGHMRVALALSNGDAAVPYKLVRLTEAEELKALATLDPLGALARTDMEQWDALRRMAGLTDDTELLRALQAEAQRDLFKPPFVHMSTPPPKPEPENFGGLADEAAPEPDDEGEIGPDPVTQPVKPATKPAEKPGIFPLAIILSRTELTRWQAWKEACAKRDDKGALFAALELAEAA